MFEIISKFIVDIIQKIAQSSIDLEENDIKKRYGSFTDLFEFYKALFEYEEAIEMSILKIRKFQSGEAILLKYKIEELIKEMFLYHSTFIKKLEPLKHYFSIYLPEIAIQLKERGGKAEVIYSFLKSVDLIPKQELINETGLTYMVSYPQKLPSQKEIEFIRAKYIYKIQENLYKRDNIKEIEKEILNELKSISHTTTINFENNDELDNALKYGVENLSRIRGSRMLLAKFIRENFDLKDIFI